MELRNPELYKSLPQLCKPGISRVVPLYYTNEKDFPQITDNHLFPFHIGHWRKTVLLLWQIEIYR